MFVDTIRNTAAAKMALLVPKGVQRYPDSGDKVRGNIDIWWIVHDGMSLKWRHLVKLYLIFCLISKVVF